MLPMRAELVDRFADFDRADNRRDVMGSAVILGALFLFLSVVNRIDGDPVREWVVTLATVALLTVIGVSRLYYRARLRDFQVRCPSCAAAFGSSKSRPFVLATGRCATCSAAVAEDALDVDAAAVVERQLAPRPVSVRKWAGVAVCLFVWLSLEFDLWDRVVAARRAANFSRANAPLVGITVQDAAARIAATRGRPSIVILYRTRCGITPHMFSDFAAMAARHPEVDVQAFDTEPYYADEVPGFLRRYGADFTPLYLREWRMGELTNAMAPLGIEVGTTFTTPLVAIRDADGYVVMREEATTNVKGMERVLERLRQP